MTARQKTPNPPQRTRKSRFLFVLLPLAVLFFLYTHALTENPPGFYVDEATFAYNAYSLATTGAGEFGVPWPLFFQHFDRPFTIFGNPVHTYMLAALFLIFPPSILLPRLLSSLAMFAAGLLLGKLAYKLTDKWIVGAFVSITALITPWFFEFARWFSDASYYPLVLALFLLALRRASIKPRWTWSDAILLALTLSLLTYTYTIGRLLGPLLGLGLICFAVNRKKFIDVVKTWLLYGLTLVPFVIFYLRQPVAVSSRFSSLSYLSTEKTLQGLVVCFITRYFQDLSLLGLLTKGDLNPRHHVPGATGSFLLATFILALVGFVIVLLNHREEPWWRFVILGTFVSVIPGALTIDPFHTGRMIAYPVFLLVLTVPALDKLIGHRRSQKHNRTNKRRPWWKWSAAWSQVALGAVVIATMAQATYFQRVFWQEGRDRRYPWDATYKEAYDVATKLPSRPIYLVDGKWGPGYVHALWYATLEGRRKSEFIHLPYRVQPPAGALVISSEEQCTRCEMIFDNNHYKVFRKL